MRTIIRDNYDPQIGDYHDKIVHDTVRNKIYLFDCDGVFLNVSKSYVIVTDEAGDSPDLAISQRFTTDGLNSKQDTLIAGDNITIEDNVISSTGGTKDYEELDNLPSIGGKTIIGDKTIADYGLQPAGDYVEDADYVHTDNNYTTEEKETLADLDERMDTAEDDIEDIQDVIPNQATSDNQLADKAFVNSSLNSITAFYITKNVQKEQFATYAELAAATEFYSGGEPRVPTRNDYCIVQADETKTDPVTGEAPTTRYIYQTNGWEFQYIVNKTTLTAVQLAALNSGITESGVGQIDTNTSNISSLQSGKQDVLTAGTGIDITNNVISATSSGPTVVQTKGTSTSNVMSQDATTKMVWPVSDKRGINIVKFNDGTYGTADVGEYNIFIGSAQNASVVKTSGTYNTIIGSGFSQQSSANRNIGLGNTMAFSGEYGMVIGSGLAGSNAIVLGGTGSSVYGAPAAYSVAIGRQSTTSIQGEVSFGGSRLGTNGYDGTAYRLLTNVHDPVSNQDAATKSYVDTNAGATINSTDWSALWQ